MTRILKISAFSASITHLPARHPPDQHQINSSSLLLLLLSSSSPFPPVPDSLLQPSSDRQADRSIHQTPLVVLSCVCGKGARTAVPVVLLPDPLLPSCFVLASSLRFLPASIRAGTNNAASSPPLCVLIPLITLAQRWLFKDLIIHFFRWSPGKPFVRKRSESRHY